jgi:hypothetical protein
MHQPNFAFHFTVKNTLGMSYKPFFRDVDYTLPWYSFTSQSDIYRVEHQLGSALIEGK